MSETTSTGAIAACINFADGRLPPVMPRTIATARAEYAELIARCERAEEDRRVLDADCAEERERANRAEALLRRVRESEAVVCDGVLVDVIAWRQLEDDIDAALVARAETAEAERTDLLAELDATRMIATQNGRRADRAEKRVAECSEQFTDLATVANRWYDERNLAEARVAELEAALRDLHRKSAREIHDIRTCDKSRDRAFAVLDADGHEMDRMREASRAARVEQDRARAALADQAGDADDMAGKDGAT